MSNKRAPGRSLDEWMDLVTECRKRHGVMNTESLPVVFTIQLPVSVKKNCQIPDPVGKASILDLTSHKQDVVQIAIEPESSPAELTPDNGSGSVHLDNSHTIEIEANGLFICMSNEIKPVLLKILMDVLKVPFC